jgi:hypothetical protein
MKSSKLPRYALACATLVIGLMVQVSPLAAQGDKKGRSISIPTFDGVALSGTLWPNPGGKRDAVVVLMHHFDPKKGGSSQTEGWGQLANALVADGYTVLSFDFRGFGESKTIDQEKFWTFPHNLTHLTKKKGDVLDKDMFRVSYYPILVNDLAAVKAYLDRRNDARELNSGNIILIGAGDAAAVGSLWLAHESRRRRDKSGGGLAVMITLGDPEVKDIAAAVWLSPNPRIGAKTVGLSAMQKWIAEAGKQNKVPMAFITGKKDGTSSSTCTNLLKAIEPAGTKNKKFPNTGIESVPETNLQGAALLEVGATAFIVKKYLPKVLEDRGTVERNERDSVKSPYYYTRGTPPTPLKIQKPAGVDVGMVDLGFMGLPGY